MQFGVSRSGSQKGATKAQEPTEPRLGTWSTSRAATKASGATNGRSRFSAAATALPPAPSQQCTAMAATRSDPGAQQVGSCCDAQHSETSGRRFAQQYVAIRSNPPQYPAICGAMHRNAPQYAAGTGNRSELRICLFGGAHVALLCLVAPACA